MTDIKIMTWPRTTMSGTAPKWTKVVYKYR
jgi:hypothetical protein